MFTDYKLTFALQNIMTSEANRKYRCLIKFKYRININLIEFPEDILALSCSFSASYFQNGLVCHKFLLSLFHDLLSSNFCTLISVNFALLTSLTVNEWGFAIHLNSFIWKVFKLYPDSILSGGNLKLFIWSYLKRSA